MTKYRLYLYLVVCLFNTIVQYSESFYFVVFAWAQRTINVIGLLNARQFYGNWLLAILAKLVGL